MEFEFNNQPVAMSKVDIEDIGNFALEANNDLGYFYYVVIQTSLGCSKVFTCGPVIPDVDILPPGYQITFDKLQFKEAKIITTITKFLNDYRKNITHAELIPFEQAAQEFRNVSEHILSDDM